MAQVLEETQSSQQICKIEECNNFGNAGRGLCHKHYSILRRHGSPNWKKPSKQIVVREYVQSDRYAKRQINPVFINCEKCGQSFFRLRVSTTRSGVQIGFAVPIRFCPKCKIVKLLEPMEIMK